MARDYLPEIRQIQPHGPYYIGGFSGGGLSAYELARQLTAAGETVGILVLLDSLPTIVPQITRPERLRYKLYQFRTQGLGYLRKWVRTRWAWERGKIERKFRKPLDRLTPAEFRSEEIGRAFYRAIPRYPMPPYTGPAVLFRPRHEEAIVFGPGRVLNPNRVFIDPQNFWTPYVKGGIEIHLVPGDHDSMVLEPHVRVMGARLKACLAAAQARWSGATAPAHSAEATHAAAR
jgi:thioesterase domain-containing protein